MGVLCIILGVVILVALCGGGYLLANALVNYQIMGQSMLSFMGMKSPSMAYIYIVGAAAVIGLIICLLFVMVGIDHNTIVSLQKRVARAEKKSKKSKAEASESDAEA